MFVGHALIAFALVAGATARFGASRERATALGLVGAAFATVPDVDMAYALVGVWQALLPAAASTTGGPGVIEGFWSTGNLVHRAVTHSLVVAPAMALAAALWVRGRCLRAHVPTHRVTFLASAAVAVGLVAVATAVSGALGGAIMGLFVVAALGVSEVTARRSEFAPWTVGAAALTGLASHPFGDLLTGEPPAMLYPFDVTLLAERPTPFVDPTLNLLTAFGAELAAIWLGVGVFLWLSGVSPHVALDRRATVGAGYAATALVLPAPTLDVSYHFVFTVLAVGIVGFVPRVELERVRPFARPRVSLPDGASAAVTALTAVTLAVVAYAGAYLLV